MKQLLGHDSDKSTVNLLEPHGFVPNKPRLECFFLNACIFFSL